MVEVVFLGILEAAFLNVVGLLKQPHRHADFRLLTQGPEHVLVCAVRASQVFSVLHSRQRIFQVTLNKQRLTHNRCRRDL